MKFSLFKNANCIAKNNITGVCRYIEDCPSIYYDLLLGKTDFTRCQIKSQKLVVCCPPRAAKSQLMSPPVSVKSSRLHERKCHEYQNSVYEIRYALQLTATAPKTPTKIDRCGFKTVDLIVGGTLAKPREFPHMALLGYQEKNQILWGCGGAIISKKFVLTAAHCMNGKLHDPKKVRVGDLDIVSNNDDARPEEINIQQIFIHPDYKISSKHNDIALIELERNIEIDPYKRPACLPLTYDWPGSLAIASGWGRTDSQNTGGSEHLQKVTIEKFTPNECTSIYLQTRTNNRNYNISYETQMCLGSKNSKKDTCQGDSGGPIQIFHQDEYCMYQIVGITSFGLSHCGSPGVPGIYTRVYPYIDWIESIAWKNE